MADKELRRGDLVEVRSPSEILATLDDRGSLEGLPFMPEMVSCCGRRFTVEQRADKVCDAILNTGSRRLPHTVLLNDRRCDGSGHDGCQAECRIFWKEAWLCRVTADAPLPAPYSEGDVAALIERTAAHTKEPAGGDRWIHYRCQATETTRCSEHLRTWDPRPYLRAYTSGNVSLVHFLRVMSRAAVEEPKRKLGLMPRIFLQGKAKKGDTFEPLHLKAGDWVRVKSKEEIAKTLDKDGKNKGLWFDREMLPFCGRVFRVRRRLERFINEYDARLVVLKNEAVTLEGVVCTGDLNLTRWFCPRAQYSYWRECWLERASPADQAAVPASKRFEQRTP